MGNRRGSLLGIVSKFSRFLIGVIIQPTTQRNLIQMSDRQKEKKETLKKRSKKTKEKREKIKDTLTIDGLADFIREIMTEEGLIAERGNPYHRADGTWGSKDNAVTYSSSRKKKYKDSKLETPARGTITKSGKISSKFGMSSGSPEKQCGKINLKTGEPKKKTRSCKDYPANYSDKDKVDEANEPNAMSSADTLYIKELIKQEIVRYTKELQSKLQSRSSKKEGACTWEEFLRLNQQYVASQEPPKN